MSDKFDEMADSLVPASLLDRDLIVVDFAAKLREVHNAAIYACRDIAEAQRRHVLGLPNSTGDDPWTLEEVAAQCEEIRDNIAALKVTR